MQRFRSEPREFCLLHPHHYRNRLAFMKPTLLRSPVPFPIVYRPDLQPIVEVSA